MITYTASAQQRTILTLDDSSVVYLNFGSSLTLPEHFSSHERKVSLKGEAFFRIAHDPDKPFIVETEQLTTHVLGTQFNVRAYAAEPAEVTVSTGRVKVAAAGAEVMLTANQQAVQEHPGTVPKVRAVDAGLLCAWRHNTLKFDMVPFNEVIRLLGRWYHIDMTVESLSENECLVRANFSNQGLVPVLEGLRHLVNFEYEIVEENKINIINRECKD